MAVITPNTDVILLKVPLEMDEVNQLTFANATAQYNYFNSLPKYVIEEGDFTYQRKDNTIRFPAQYDDILQYNYVMYRNTSYSDKWFYAFITGIEYLNDNVTAIGIKTDVWQTWCFNLTYKPVFVEREHVNDDTVGLHTVPEGLQTGEYISNNQNNVSPLASDITWPSGYTYEGGNYMIAFQVSELLDSFYAVANVAQNYNGIYSGLFILGVDSAEDALKFIRGYDSEGKGDAIVSCFITYPHFFNAGYAQSVGTHGYSVTLYPAKTGDGNTLLKASITMGSGMIFNTLDGYIPKNNKLKTYPYCYYLVDNNAGQTATFYNEFFSSTPSFDIRGAIGQGNSTKLIPKNYKGDTTANGNYQEGIQGGKLPVCAWASDYYLNWVTQNAINLNTNVISSVTGSAISGGLSGGITGAVTSAGTSGLMAVISNIAKTETAKIMPDQARGNVNVSDLNIGFYGKTAPSLFNIRAMSVRQEYARIIDDFFTMYGYKVNTVKIPNITGRRNWNYVKTIGCYIDADIPQSDLQEIKNMFDNGVTFWHNPATFADYTQNNDII